MDPLSRPDTERQATRPQARRTPARPAPVGMEQAPLLPPVPARRLPEQATPEQATNDASQGVAPPRTRRAMVPRHAFIETNERRVLFYPCCGTDFETAIRVGQTLGINEYWFVDVGYLAPEEHRATCAAGCSYSDPTRALLSAASIHAHHIEDGLVSAQLERLPLQDHAYPALKKTISYNGVRYVLLGAKGVQAMRQLLPPVRAFFYRGDSRGEVGSGDLWLTGELRRELLGKLEPEAYLITDGSNGYDKDAWRQLGYKSLNEVLQRPNLSISDLPALSEEGMQVQPIGLVRPQVSQGVHRGALGIWKVSQRAKP